MCLILSWLERIGEVFIKNHEPWSTVVLDQHSLSHISIVSFNNKAESWVTEEAKDVFLKRKREDNKDNRCFREHNTNRYIVTTKWALIMKVSGNFENRLVWYRVRFFILTLIGCPVFLSPWQQRRALESHFPFCPKQFPLLSFYQKCLRFHGRSLVQVTSLKWFPWPHKHEQGWNWPM